MKKSNYDDDFLIVTVCGKEIYRCHKDKFNIDQQLILVRIYMNKGYSKDEIIEYLTNCLKVLGKY